VQSRGDRTGFTLTELLIVVVIIGILATLALPMFIKSVEKARAGEAVTNLNLIKAAQKIYFLENREFSEDIESLNIESPNDTAPRYFFYSIDPDGDFSTNFTARAARGGEGAQAASSPYDTHEYTIDKDGVVEGPLL
jgi:prepilin-type N-terminal cleavage/methylation domain-containing protein